MFLTKSPHNVFIPYVQPQPEVSILVGRISGPEDLSAEWRVGQCIHGQEGLPDKAVEGEAPLVSGGQAQPVNIDNKIARPQAAKTAAVRVIQQVYL